MNGIVLTAKEAARLRRDGEIRLHDGTSWLHRPVQGETVAVLEPWYRLKAPERSNRTDLTVRYIRQAEATAPPYSFSYRRAEDMPMEAVGIYALVEQLGDTVLLRIKQEPKRPVYYIK